MKKKNVCFALICLLSCPNGVLFNTQNDEREKIPLKIGENFTLNLPAEYMAVGEVTGVLWTKQDNAFLEISNNNEPLFLNKTFKLKVCSYNLSSITICNATSEDAGRYRPNIQYKNKNLNNTFHKAYYVEHVEELNVAPGYNRTLLDIISKVVKPSVTSEYNRTRDGISSDNTHAITVYVFLAVVLVIIILVIGYFVYKKKCGQEQNPGNNPNHEPVPQNDNIPQEMAITNGSCQQHSGGNSNGYGPVAQAEEVV